MLDIMLRKKLIPGLNKIYSVILEVLEVLDLIFLAYITNETIIKWCSRYLFVTKCFKLTAPESVVDGFLPIITRTCLIGFKSGVRGGHSKILTPVSWKKCKVRHYGDERCIAEKGHVVGHLDKTVTCSCHTASKKYKRWSTAIGDGPSNHYCNSSVYMPLNSETSITLLSMPAFYSLTGIMHG